MEDEDRRSIQKMPRLVRRPTHPTIARVGNFVLRELIGQGAMGCIYVGVHEKLGSKVAIKLIQPHMAEVPGSRERFFDEARAVARLSHQGLIRIHDFGTLETGELYSVMELLEGGDVETLLRDGGPLAARRAVPIAAQVASALAVVHDAGVVHCDVKPENIFLASTREGVERAVLLDFGIAKLSTRTAPQGTDVSGTPAYMAPEQARSTQGIDGRADVYALGCSMFEMLTGRPPFGGETQSDVLIAHQVERPPRLAQIVPSVPVGLDRAVARCLEKDRDHRWPEMRSLRDALLAVPLG